MSDYGDKVGDKRQKTFVSYSRIDGHRVKGLVEFLRAADNDVFWDRQILAGQRWSEAIDDEIATSDAMVVFWTKSAAASKYVAKEYSLFMKDRLDAKLFAVVGDGTPLTEALAAHQSVDFLPLLNELEQLRQNMETDGASRADVRAAIAARLKDEGLEIKDGSLRRMLGYMGLRGVEGYPSRFMEALNGYLLETKSKVAVMLALVAIAGAWFGAFVGPRDRIPVPNITSVPIELNMTGRRACEEKGLVCQSVSQTKIYDNFGAGEFFGYSTPTCASTVQKAADCGSRGYEIDRVTIVRSKTPDSPQDFSHHRRFCLKTPRYEHANCVSALGD